MGQGIKIPEPKVNIELDQLSINLVMLEKVKLYVNEIENLPWISGFLFLFLGALLDKILTKGLDTKDPTMGVLLLVIVVFLILTAKTYYSKRTAWNAVEKSKIDLKER